MHSYSDHNRHAFTVSELNRQVKSLLESSFLQVRVQGEISNFSKPASGHWYFTLKDGKAQVKCALFRNRNLRVRFSPKDGDQVVLTAKVSLYEGRGDYQLIGEMLESDGEGQLQQAFEALKTSLAKEGLFANAHKKSIPAHPKHLGVITSPTGAAIHDILSVLKRRFPSLPVTVYPSAVQGAGAATQLISALEAAQRHKQADLIIIGRGGGSLEDLWPFNDEKLARALFACTLPIISAVGHEVDYSISDLVADLRAPTPSAAAELISPDQDALRILLDRQANRLDRQLKETLTRHRQRVLHLRQRLRHPGDRIREQKARLSNLEQRLLATINHRLVKAKHQSSLLEQQLIQFHPRRQIEQISLRLVRNEERLTHQFYKHRDQKRYALGQLATRLNAISPLATLERGYAIIQDNKGKVVTQAQQVKTGDVLINRLHQGSFSSRVETIYIDNNSDNTANDFENTHD
ncbi:exodeoxyribonuclease VII large subunit [Neptunomonas antarctica]|uniref:Exodeoxyribonuclease 7 large subunit n=1 Tax=Neptunomonas antarctica TaxID=619304 RepID=A0A1N7JFZ6_9GAMM|nr:exodeoxyribonuclease VII large subunit [Neptunomonas antarctica]SIS48230.1 Exodeoxyribonuclease VII large subunit [Neptunomonas antarctica]